MHATCTRQTHYAYTCYVRNALYYQWWLSLYVRKYSHYTPCPFSLFLLPNPHCLPRRTDWMFALRSSSDLSKVQTNNCIPAAHFGFACACVTGVSVVHQACAPGLQTGASSTGLVDARVSHTCARHRLCAPGLQTCACGTGLADGGVKYALLDVAFSLSHSISISFSLARFPSLSYARSFSLSFSLSLSHTHSNMLGAIILMLMPSDSN